MLILNVAVHTSLRFNKEKLHSLVTERCYPVSFSSFTTVYYHYGNYSSLTVTIIMEVTNNLLILPELPVKHSGPKLYHSSS